MIIVSSLPRRRFRLTWVVLTVAYLAGWSVAFPALSAEVKPAGSFQIDSWTFDRGNGWVIGNPDMYADYRDKFPQLVTVDDGSSPWCVEYDVDFPVDTTYTLQVCYGSPEQRPMEVWLDGRKIGECCGRVTGNPPPYMDRHPQHNLPRDERDFHGIEWEEACKLKATKGKHTLKFTREEKPPRLHAFRLESSVAFPKEWKPAAREPNLDRMQANCRQIFLPPDGVNVEALRLAIEDMIAAFGPQYPNGPQYLKQLAELDKKQRAVNNGTPQQKEPIQKALSAVRSRAMLSHPALKFDKLLFMKQKGRGFSTYTGHLIKGNPGGNLCVLSPVAPGGKVTELVPELPNGVFGRFDLSFDATKVVFCHAKDGGLFRIYEIDIDPKTGRRTGTKLRQLTFSSDREAKTIEQFGGTSCGKGYDDIDPIYLPGGNIMFASTRCERSVLCFPASVTALHLMDADGKNIRCISRGQVNEINPCLLDDGRVIYMRWEYVDKGFGNAQSLWLIRPDGSGSDHVHKNSLVRPGAMTNACSIPGSRKIITIAAGHHGGMEGPVVLVDNRHNRRNAQGLTNITPELSYPGLFPMKSTGGPFREPSPFSEKFYLVSHRSGAGKNKNGNDFDIYTLDAWGNRAELYRDPEFSCHQPTPLRPRRVPPMIASVADTETVDTSKAKMEGLATMFLADVYQGLTGVELGRVKYIRVMDALNLGWHDTYRAGKQGDAGGGQQASAVSLGGDVAIKKVHGIATVHEDGSAFFTVPANENIFFQALDENFMELQRMRTFINLMPGENRSCIGCHEVRRKAPNLKRANPIALDHPVEALYFQPGDSGPRMVHYARDVQPILDKHCVTCHGSNQPKGELTLTGDPTTHFSRSYENLSKKNLVSYLHTSGFGSSHVPAEPPLTFGSHRSKMVERIQKAPCKSNITREEFIRIVTWIDANAPFYGTHRGKKNLKWKDDPDFRPMPLAGK